MLPWGKPSTKSWFSTRCSSRICWDVSFQDLLLLRGISRALSLIPPPAPFHHPCGDGGRDLWPLLHAVGGILIVFISSFFFLATFPFNLVNSCKSTGSPIWASNSFFTVVVGVLKVSSPLSAKLCFYLMYERQKRGSVLTETVHLRNAFLFLRITHLRFVLLLGALREKEGDVTGEEKQRDTNAISCFYSIGSSERGAMRSHEEPRGAERSH